MTQRSTPLLISLVATLALAFVVPAAAAAQETGEGFLFKTPRVTLGIRGGFAMPRAGSDIFDFTSETLTLETSDYYGATLGGNLAIRLSERFDLSLDLAFAGSQTLSETRDWIGSDDLPIQQTTEFRRIPATVSLKAYLWNRGRTIGRFAWVPRSWVPYVGAGAGYVWYRFEQEGEFVEEPEDPAVDEAIIFSDRYLAEGKAGTYHVFAGVDYSLNHRLILTGEGRYSFASAPMEPDFVDYKLDLAGLQATIGISVRF